MDSFCISEIIRMASTSIPDLALEIREELAGKLERLADENQREAARLRAMAAWLRLVKDMTCHQAQAVFASILREEPTLEDFEQVAAGDPVYRRIKDGSWRPDGKVLVPDGRAALRLKERPAAEPATAKDIQEVKALITEESGQLKKHVTRRTGQLRKGGGKPGPKMTDERKADLVRVRTYVKEGFSVSKACDLVDAQNRERDASAAHYASAAAMRDAYRRWGSSK